MMDIQEAMRIARTSIRDHHDLELVTVAGKSVAIPRQREKGGEALHPEQQEAADAYNWLAHELPKSISTR